MAVDVDARKLNYKNVVIVMSTLVSQLSRFPCSPLHAVWQVNTKNKNGITMEA
jgi:hypothetical protein